MNENIIFTIILGTMTIAFTVAMVWLAIDAIRKGHNFHYLPMQRYYPPKGVNTMATRGDDDCQGSKERHGIND